VGAVRQLRRHPGLGAALASVGWQAWNWYQNRNAGEAGALYYAVQQAAEQQDAQKAATPPVG
jgi:hypothetical protein